jgi:hypothetical protein
MADDATPTPPEEAAPTTQGLEGLSETALRARHAANVAEVERLRTVRDRSLADSREMHRLTAEANQIAGLVQEMNTDPEFVPLDVPPPAPVTREEVVAEDPQVVEVEHFVEGQEPQMEEAVAAAAAIARAASAPGPEQVPEVDPADVPHESLVASAANGRWAPGTPLSLTDVGAIAASVAGDPSQQGKNVGILTIQKPFTPTVLPSNSAAANSQAIAAALGDETLQAALTVCGPPDILRDVPECLNTSRYVDGWFRTIPAAHGQIQFYRPFGLSDVASAVTVWTQTQQDAVVDATPGTWKPCPEIGCLPTATASQDAIPSCLTMKVFDTMTSPEAVGSALFALRAQTARTADGHLLQLFDALASRYTFDATQSASHMDLGATIDLYDLIGRLLGMVSATNRDIDAGQYTIGIEAGLLAHANLDVVSACNPQEAQDELQPLLAGLGIGAVKVTPDWSLAAGSGPWSGTLPINAVGNAAVAVPARPTTWTIRLFAPSDFGMLSAGEENFGVVPDLDNKRRNKITWFGEIWQGLAKIGCRPAFSVQVTGLQASGVRAGCASATAFGS